MIPADETEPITPPTKPFRLYSLWQALIRVPQGIRARRASAYARAQEWVVELREVIGRAGREAVIRLQSVTVAIAGRLSDLLLWLRFVALLCMLMGGLLRMAEPDTWLGRPFASRFEAAKAGYRTLLQSSQEEGPRRGGIRLTRNDPGFHEILELTLATEQRLRDNIATEQVGLIETIYAPDVGLPRGVGSAWPSTPERMFRAPFRIRLEDQQGKSGWAILDYTEADLKARFFMPKLRWWALLAVWAGFIINVLLLPFPSPRKSHQPIREE